MKKLDLKEVRDRFELYKVAFNKNPYINNLANELGVKTTTLMKFIVDNDKHFVMYQNDKGTYISQIYLDLKNKPGSDEFVAYNKEKYKNTIFLDPYIYPYCYDVSFHRIIEDEKDNERSNEWRNTPEKVKKVREFIEEYISSSGYNRRHLSWHQIPKECIELLMSQGWKFENYDENSDR